MCSKLLNPINSDLLGDIYDAFVSAGVTPTAKTPDAIIAAITTLKNDSVAAGADSATCSISLSYNQYNDSGHQILSATCYKNGKQITTKSCYIDLTPNPTWSW